MKSLRVPGAANAPSSAGRSIRKSTISCQAGRDLILFFRKVGKFDSHFAGAARKRDFGVRACCVGRNRHPEQRSDPAIQESRGALRSPGLLRFARNDAAGSTEMQYVLRTGNDSGSVPQAIENAENGLGNGKPSACVFSLGDLIMRAPYCPSLAPTCSAGVAHDAAGLRSAKPKPTGRKTLRKIAAKPLKRLAHVNLGATSSVSRAQRLLLRQSLQRPNTLPRKRPGPRRG